MIKSIQILVLVAIFGLMFNSNQKALGNPIDSSLLEQKLNKDLRKKIFMEELDEYDRKLDQKLLDFASRNRINKRSDIDARLLELQAKILLTKAYAQMPAGHGKFNFDQIGKRSVSQDSFEIYNGIQKLSDYSSEETK